MAHITESAPRTPPPPPPPRRASAGTTTFDPAPGTRDFFPDDLLRRRHLTEAWRRASIIHGFDEIDGPAFEHLGLYEARSGPEITNRLFTFKRSGGIHQFALRPEFTPTVARMYAERHASLATPVRWFSVQNCFRAERPGTGRLREIWQWNVDVLGDSSPAADADVIAVAVAALKALGLGPADVRVKVSNREVVSRLLSGAGVQADRMIEVFETLDLRGKVSRAHLVRSASALGFDLNAFDNVATQVARALSARRYDALLRDAGAGELGALGGPEAADLYQLADLARALDAHGLLEWCDFDLSVVCGIAYYTGAVFQFRDAGPTGRLIAAGGRYDTLVEALGGPATPAVGLGMADDQVLAVLCERGRVPSDEALREALGARVDVLVTHDQTDAAAKRATSVLSQLREAGLHARARRAGAPSATDSNARCTLHIDSADTATITRPGQPPSPPVPAGEVWIAARAAIDRRQPNIP